ncbi:hypothetical protein ACROYT_G036996 [Oculina patagonica]
MGLVQSSLRSLVLAPTTMECSILVLCGSHDGIDGHKAKNLELIKRLIYLNHGIQLTDANITTDGETAKTLYNLLVREETKFKYLYFVGHGDKDGNLMFPGGVHLDLGAFTVHSAPETRFQTVELYLFMCYGHEACERFRFALAKNLLRFSVVEHSYTQSVRDEINDRAFAYQMMLDDSGVMTQTTSGDQNRGHYLLHEEVKKAESRRALSSALVAFAWRLYLTQPLRILFSLKYDWIAEMASALEERWQTNRSTVLERNKFMFNNPVMSDIKFVFPKKQTFLAHKNVLAISSPVFFAMFYGELAEQGESIDITDFDPDDFLQFLRYLYYDDTNFQNVDRAIQLCYLADKYDIPSLARECVNFIGASMDPLNAFDIIPHARRFNHQGLETVCWEVVDYNAQEIVADDSFLEVKHAFLLSFLERSSLRIDEVTLFEAVDRWAARRCEEENKTVNGANKRSILGEDLLKHFRFSLMSPQGFSDHVEPTEILSKNEALDVFKQFASGSVPGGIKFSILPRIGNSVPLHSCSLGTSYPARTAGLPELLESTRHVPKAWMLTFAVNREIALCGVKIITGTVEKQPSCRVSRLSVVQEGQTLTQIRDKEFTTENGPSDAYGQIDVFFNRPLRLSEDTCYTIETETDTTQDKHLFVWSKSFEES